MINRRIHDRYVMLSVGVKFGDELCSFCVTIADGIIFEISVLVHIVDVRPNRLQRYAELGESVHHVFDYGPVFVAPATLVESKCPVLLHGGQTHAAFLV